LSALNLMTIYYWYSAV